MEGCGVKTGSACVLTGRESRCTDLTIIPDNKKTLPHICRWRKKMPLLSQNKQIDRVISTTELFTKYSHLKVSAVARPVFINEFLSDIISIWDMYVFVFRAGKCQNISLQTLCDSGPKVPALCSAEGICGHNASRQWVLMDLDVHLLLHNLFY